MTWRYDEQWVNEAVAPILFKLYKDAGRVFGDDPTSCAWPSRVMAGIWEDGLTPEASLHVHANECADALGVPRPFPGRSPLVLPPCGSCPTPYSYDQMLPWSPPANRDYLRGNFWGIPVSVNGVSLPWVPGVTSSSHPERFLSYLFPLYPQPYQERWFTECQLRGYTHGLQSWPDARARAGQSLEAFVADCRRFKAALPYLHVKLGSKDFDPHDQTLAQWKALLDPLMESLAGIADEFSFWEYDAFNLDGQIALDIHHYFGSKAHRQGATFWCHFNAHVPFWDPRGDAYWWTDLGRDVDGLDYQAEQTWDIGELQARSVDILNLFSTTGHKLRQFEPGTPMLMFDGDHPNEDEADAFGYLSVCTKAKTFAWGFGAGARNLDGSPL